MALQYVNTNNQLIPLNKPFISIYHNLLYKAEKLSVRPSASRDNLSGFCMDRLGTWIVHS